MIHAEKATFPVTRMAELLDVSTSGYYAWVKRQHAEPGPRAARRAALAKQITAFHEASDGVNGSPRILADLRDAGQVVSRKTVAKIMITTVAVIFVMLLFVYRSFTTVALLLSSLVGLVGLAGGFVFSVFFHNVRITTDHFENWLLPSQFGALKGMPNNP